MNTKIKWLLDNGFKKEWCEHRKTTVFNYKMYSWTREETKEVPLSTLMAYKRFYDGEISEKELHSLIA